MNTRIFSVMIAATLMTVSTGCSGMRNFLFGRGARCGLCSTATAPAPYTAPAYTAPQYTAPAPQYVAPAPQQYVAPQCNTPQYSAPPPARRPGCGLRNWFGWGRNVAPPQPCQNAMPCENWAPCTSCYGSEFVGDCGCGGTSPMVTDPYMVQPGQIIEGDTIIQDDDFSARRFDTDGARIIWEDPATEL